MNFDQNVLMKIVLTISLFAYSKQFFGLIAIATIAIIGSAKKDNKKSEKFVEDMKNFSYNISKIPGYLSGKCYWKADGVAENTFEVTLDTSKSNQSIEIVGSNILTPEWIKDNKIPYLYFQTVETIKRSNDSYDLVVKLKTLKGVTSQFICSTRYKLDSFINNCNINKEYVHGLFKTSMDVIKQNAAEYATRKKLYAAISDEHLDLDGRINYCNDHLGLIVKAISENSKLLDDKKILKTSILSSLSANRLDREKKRKSNETCFAQRNAIERLFKAYSHYQTMGDQVNKYEYLNKETTNLCKFHLLAEDINIILPSNAPNLDEKRDIMARKHDIGPVVKLLHDDPYYIHDEDDEKN